MDSNVCAWKHHIFPGTLLAAESSLSCTTAYSGWFFSQECDVHQQCPSPIHQLQPSRSESQPPRVFKFFPMVLLGTRPIKCWDISLVVLSSLWLVGGFFHLEHWGDFVKGHCTPQANELKPNLLTKKWRNSWEIRVDRFSVGAPKVTLYRTKCNNTFLIKRFTSLKNLV